ncbi:hypothetical protein BKA80DRAFT_253095 [Phyllosticta citrichinensis]
MATSKFVECLDADTQPTYPGYNVSLEDILAETARRASAADFFSQQNGLGRFSASSSSSGRSSASNNRKSSSLSNSSSPPSSPTSPTSPIAAVKTRLRRLNLHTGSSSRD